MKAADGFVRPFVFNHDLLEKYQKTGGSLTDGFIRAFSFIHANPASEAKAASFSDVILF